MSEHVFPMGEFRGGVDEVARALVALVKPDVLEERLRAGVYFCPDCEKFRQPKRDARHRTVDRGAILSSLSIMTCDNCLEDSGMMDEETRLEGFARNLLLPAFAGVSDAELARLTGLSESTVPNNEYVRTGRLARRALREASVLAAKRTGATTAGLVEMAGKSESWVKRVIARGRISDGAQDGIPLLYLMLEDATADGRAGPGVADVVDVLRKHCCGRSAEEFLRGPERLEEATRHHAELERECAELERTNARLDGQKAELAAVVEQNNATIARLEREAERSLVSLT